MSVKIRDERFSPPSVLNTLPCIASDRYLKTVQESVIIQRVCIVPDNTNLVLIDFALVGVFLYTPSCRIVRVDNDTSYFDNNVIAPIAQGYVNNSDIPLNTHCQTYYGHVAFDFGRVIPEFSKARVIEFLLTMNGSLPQAFGLQFISQSPSQLYSWQKGIFPNPLSLYTTEGNLVVVFDYNPAAECSCNIQCITPTGISHSINYCPDNKQELVISNAGLSGDPYNLSIEFRDTLGNTSQLLASILVGANVKPVYASVHSNPRRVEVGITRQSLNGTLLTEVEYQLLKFDGTANNLSIWKDWSYREWSNFVDYDVTPGKTYGYAVRYKGKFQETSNLSNWTVVTI